MAIALIRAYDNILACIVAQRSFNYIPLFLNCSIFLEITKFYKKFLTWIDIICTDSHVYVDG